jgi:hypothetical protein
MRLGSHILIGFIWAYRLVLSPVLPMSCRYHPTCSNYACQALARHGALRGAWLTLARILRCHPWRAGGFDPVPERFDPPLAGALHGLRLPGGGSGQGSRLGRGGS